MTAPVWSLCLSEFIGTYFLVLSVGCNVLDGSPVWAVTSIASTLMVVIYALGGVSGGHFNPAVTIAVAISQKLDSWATAGAYIATQLVAGVLAGFTYMALYGSSFNLAPAAGFTWAGAMVAETLYTFMLCFVVLNVACCQKNLPNNYYALAIGFVIVAGGYGAGSISGGAFNPAVAFGIDLSSWQLGFGWSFAYALFEIVGAGIAAALFRVVRPEEFSDKAPADPSLVSKLVSEFLGTYFLVLTVGMNVLGGSQAVAWSIAAALMSMIYALGSCSGAHFNPAVTVALLLSGRGVCSPADAGAYIVVQIIAGMMAGGTYSATFGKSFGLPMLMNYVEVGASEMVFTFLLCFVVLTVATTTRISEKNNIFGFAIGSCVTVGGFAIGSVSGGCLNPAVSIGIETAFGFADGMEVGYWLLMQMLGALLAVGLFRVTYPEEYYKGHIPLSRKLKLPLHTRTGA